MTWLLEDPTPWFIAGAVLITMAAIVYSSLRTNGSLAALAAAIVMAVAGVAAEWLIQTPREQAEAAMDGLLATVEGNDLPGVLRRITPTATVLQAEANRLMPEFLVEKANRIGELEVTLDDPAAPTAADVKCRVFVSARHRRSGAKGGDMLEITFHFVRRGEDWLLDSYTGSDKWRDGAAKLRSQR